MHLAFMETYERLKWARERVFDSATAASEALGVPYPTYAGHENGNRGFGLEEAQTYARKFKVNVLWLMFEVGEPTGRTTIDEMVMRLPEDKRNQALSYLDFLLSGSPPQNPI